MRFPIKEHRLFLNDLPLDKLLIDAARTDNEAQLLKVFSDGGDFDINYRDGWVSHQKLATLMRIADGYSSSVGNTGTPRCLDRAPLALNRLGDQQLCTLRERRPSSFFIGSALTSVQSIGRFTRCSK